MTGESLPPHHGLQSTASIGLAIVIIGFLVIIGTLCHQRAQSRAVCRNSAKSLDRNARSNEESVEVLRLAGKLYFTALAGGA